VNKIILTDCDGVLLNWQYAFDCWIKSKGYIKLKKDLYSVNESYAISRGEAVKLIIQFNESATIGYLPPLRDSIHYIKKLHEEKGYIFHVITSLSKNIYAQKLREQNLQKLFGSAIDRVICLDTGEDKNKALEPYRDSGLLWVEDKIENARLGEEMGLEPVLMQHRFNMHASDIYKVDNWKEIFHIVE
jgi:hypothetical protein